MTPSLLPEDNPLSMVVVTVLVISCVMIVIAVAGAARMLWRHMKQRYPKGLLLTTVPVTNTWPHPNAAEGCTGLPMYSRATAAAQHDDAAAKVRYCGTARKLVA